MKELPRPTRPPERPIVLTRIEVDLLLAEMSGTHALIARLLYGPGMRLMECMKLHMKYACLDPVENYRTLT